MVKKPTKKKANRPIKAKGSSAVQEFDYSKFQTMFDAWKQQCGASGAKIGMTSGASLLDVIKQHGIAARPYTKDKLNREEGAVTIVELLEEWDNDATILEEVDVLELDKVISKLDKLRDSKADPRNIKFTVPIPGEIDEDTGDYDEDDTTTVYGHYRTPDYIKYRNILADIPGSKVNKETVEAAKSHWYEEGSNGKNTAKPPMWQALFATGDGDIVSTGLFKICQEAKKLIKDVKITNLKLKVDDDNLGLLAKDLFEIPSVKRWLLQQVGTQTTIGPGIDPKTKHWRDRPMHREISSQKFGVKGLAQTDFIKEAADFDKYVGTIETFQLDITRRQVRKLATLTGICKKYPGRDVVYHISKDAVKKKKKKKETKGVKKSWQEIIGN